MMEASCVGREGDQEGKPGESENIRKTREAAEEEWNQLFSHLSSWQAGPRTAG